jgi:hypothetical protein
MEWQRKWKRIWRFIMTTAGTSSPVHLTSDQIKELASGRGAQFGEPSRPRALTAKHVETLIKGGDVDLDKIPVLERTEHTHEAVASEISGSRPRVLTDKDVAALREGKDVDLQKREPLGAQ